MFDLLLSRGSVVDGTGRPMFHTDAGIEDERRYRPGLSGCPKVWHRR
jgi:hypothetical protein